MRGMYSPDLEEFDLFLAKYKGYAKMQQFPLFGPPPRGGSARTVQPGHFISLWRRALFCRKRCVSTKTSCDDEPFF